MAHVLIAAIVSFSLLFGGMILLGLLVWAFTEFPWILLALVVYTLWRTEVRPWLSTRTMHST